MSAKSILRRWLAEGEIERTIKALQRIAENSGDGYFMDEVILVSGRYSGLQKERRKGLIGDEPFRVESAKIRDSLLSLTGEVPADAVLDTDSSQAGIEQAADVEAEGEPENKPPNPKSLAERPEPSSPAPGKGRSWFFGIGINRYPHFSRLHNAVKDVQDICRVLQEEYGLAPEHTITLFDEEATRENIITRLDELARLVAPEDKLLIYYSGHGHLNETTGRGFWIPHDARKQNTSQYLHNSIVKEYLEDINSLHTLLISDACFSGSLFYRGEMKAGEPSAIEELERRKSRWALCSGRHDEQVYDGEPGGNSPFAAGILDSLQQPGRAVLHVAKLADEVVLTTRANYRQTPEGNPMFGLGHKGGQYVFRRKGLNDANVLLQEEEPESVEATHFQKIVTTEDTERRETILWIVRWFACLLAATAILAIPGVLISNPLMSKGFLFLVPFVYYLVPFVPAAFSRLGRERLLLLSSGHALIYYSLLVRWKLNSGEEYSWWQFAFMLTLGAVYYIIVPWLGKKMR